MTVAQLEHAATFTDVSPAGSARERLEQLFKDLRGELIIVKTKEMQLEMFDRRFGDPECQAADRRNEILNRLSQAQLRAAVLSNEIDETILSAAEDIKAARALAEVTTA